MRDDLLIILAACAGLFAVWKVTQSTPIDGMTGASESFNGATDLTGALVTIGESIGVDMGNIWKPPAAAAPYLSAIASAEAQYGLPNNLLARLLYQESRFRPDIITGKTRSRVGALGIAQFMPATAKQFGIDPLNPFEAIPAAAKYLAQLYGRFGDWQKAVASYNWGQGNVSKKGLDNAPAETKNYISQILGDLGLA